MLVSYPRICSDDTRYAYSVGRIRALESKLLSSHKIARLLESDSGADLLRGLQDTDYSQLLPENPRDYERMIKSARTELYELLDKLVIDDVFVALLKVKHDYRSAKLLLKGSIANKDVKELLSRFGNMESQEMMSIFSEEKYDRLSYSLSKAVPEAISLYYTNKDPRFLDIVLDQYYYSYMLEQSGINPFLQTLLKIEVDLTNIKSLLRIKQLGEGLKLFRKVFIRGSWLGLSYFSRSLDEQMDAVPRYFEHTPYARVLSEGTEFMQSRDSFLKLEKLCDDFAVEFLRKAKYLTFGVEPVVAYFYAKENEFKILRMIFVGKLNQIPDELIKERLPEVY
jgi:V/A-type H+-transporting ATPase subunit C